MKAQKKNILLVFALMILLPVLAAAQGNAFNFQGRLNDGANPANGAYDLQFSLYSAITGGTLIGTKLRPNTALINGVFSVNLDFDASAFNNPNAVFIEIGVKPNGSPNAYTILGPRQQLTVVPFAIRASSATNADNATNAVSAQYATTAGSAVFAGDSTTLNGISSSGFIQNRTSTQPNSNFNISGDGVISGNLTVQGNNISGGNTQQNRDKNGLVKALVYVKFNGTILRCYNGVTGSTTGNCGISIDYSGQTNPGVYALDFPFQVNDRFVTVTAESGSSVTLNATYNFTVGMPNRVVAQVRITDVDHDGSNTAGDFMIIVF